MPKRFVVISLKRNKFYALFFLFHKFVLNQFVFCDQKQNSRKKEFPRENKKGKVETGSGKK